MKVWYVLGKVNYEYEEVLGIFSTEDKALRYVNKANECQKKYKRYDDIYALWAKMDREYYDFWGNASKTFKKEKIIAVNVVRVIHRSKNSTYHTYQAVQILDYGDRRTVYFGGPCEYDASIYEESENHPPADKFVGEYCIYAGGDEGYNTIISQEDARRIFSWAKPYLIETS